MNIKTEVKKEDIIPINEYKNIRNEKRASLIKLKKNRRIDIGPYSSWYFENFETMWFQIHEMLFIEQGGEEQIDDELSAYNPLIPKGYNLSATIMFEIENAKKRSKLLRELGGIENTAFIQINDLTIKGEPSTDLQRSTSDGRASAVQYIFFNFNDEQITLFKNKNTKIIIGFTHPKYQHMTIVPEEMHKSLASDFI